VTLELYHAPQSTCSQKVRIGLAEKGLDWTERRVNLAKNEQLRPEYLVLNPNGVVPTLVHDGKVVIDSSVILEYLDEVFPEVRLSPADPVRRAQMRAWMRFFEEVATAAIRVPSFHMALANRFNELDESQFRATEADVRPVRKNFYRRMGPQGFSEADVAAALDELKRTVERMEKALEREGGPWLLGGDYTLADIVVTPSIDRMNDLGLSAIWAKLPRVSAWYARMQTRPAFRKAYFPGSRLSEFMTLKPLHVPVPA
jgi:glutathione S-transferase